MNTTLELGKERKDEKPPSKDHPPRTNSSRTSHEIVEVVEDYNTFFVKLCIC